MFEQGNQNQFIRDLLNNNPVILKKEIIALMVKEKLAKASAKTPLKSYNRAFVKVLKERGVTINRKNPTKPDTIIESLEGKSQIVEKEDIIDGPPPKTWYKKLLKTGKTSDPKFKTTLKIEIYTFEDNDSCRFDSLLQGVIDKVPEISYIDDAGYSSNIDSSGEFQSQFIDYKFPFAYLVVESGQGTYFYNGIMTLKDQNEGISPC